MTGLGERIRQRRLVLGLSQEALAEAVGVSVRSIIRWEKGQAAPYGEYRRRLARVFEVDIEDLTLPSGSPRPQQAISQPSGTSLCAATPSSPDARLCSSAWPSHSYRATRLQPSTCSRAWAALAKPQTALECAYRYADRYRGVFWVSADTREGCLAALGELHSVLDLPLYPDPDFGRILTSVREWFRRNAGWLLVLDNLEDPALIDEVAPTGRGSTLVTTRAQAIGAAGGRIELVHLPRPEGVHFLLRRAKILAPDSSLDEAADHL